MSNILHVAHTSANILDMKSSTVCMLAPVHELPCANAAADCKLRIAHLQTAQMALMASSRSKAGLPVFGAQAAALYRALTQPNVPHGAGIHAQMARQR